MLSSGSEVLPGSAEGRDHPAGGETAGRAADLNNWTLQAWATWWATVGR